MGQVLCFNLPGLITLASRGWQRVSRDAIKGGHAEHIHSNWDCTYAIRFDGKGGVAGYDPEKYLRMYEGAEGDTPREKINAMRRENYAEHKEEINAQKRAAYAERKEQERGLSGSGGSGIIKNGGGIGGGSHDVFRNSDLPNGLPIRAEPFSIADKVDDDGKVFQRRYYGHDGMAAKDFDTTDHGDPYKHPNGAHKHEFDYSKRNAHGKALPLSEEELNENRDIIRRGENYNDDK